MTIGDICTRQVVCATANATAARAAELMREFHVGTLVVVDESNGAAVPVGLVTDRDLVVGVIAPRLDPESILVGDIMNRLLLTAEEDDDVYDTVRVMGEQGIRRLPVVDSKGRLTGIVSQDDLCAHLAQELTALALISGRQQMNEATARI